MRRPNLAISDADRPLSRPADCRPPDRDAAAGRDAAAARQDAAPVRLRRARGRAGQRRVEDAGQYDPRIYVAGRADRADAGHVAGLPPHRALVRTRRAARAWLELWPADARALSLRSRPCFREPDDRQLRPALLALRL